MVRISAHEYCPGHGTEPAGDASDRRAIECPTCSPADDAPRHGTALLREHRSVRRHLVEDHGLTGAEVADLSDAAVHGIHDGSHATTWAYARDLPHTAETVEDSRWRLTLPRVRS